MLGLGGKGNTYASAGLERNLTEKVYHLPSSCNYRTAETDYSRTLERTKEFKCSTSIKHVKVNNRSKKKTVTRFSVYEVRGKGSLNTVLGKIFPFATHLNSESASLSISNY